MEENKELKIIKKALRIVTGVLLLSVVLGFFMARQIDQWEADAYANRIDKCQGVAPQSEGNIEVRIIREGNTKYFDCFFILADGTVKSSQWQVE